MYERLKRLYQVEKRLTIKNMKKAVILGWITEAQYKEITGEDYSA